MAVSEKNEQLLSVISEIADKECDNLGIARVRALSLFGGMMGVSKQAVSVWLVKGVPSGRRETLHKLMLEKGIERTDDEFEALFASREKAEDRRRSNKALEAVIKEVRKGGSNLRELGEAMGIPEWTLQRCASNYGGLPQNYLVALKGALARLGIVIDDALVGDCGVSDRQHVARSLTPQKRRKKNPHRNPHSGNLLQPA
ncbi:hypothetical protein AA14337_0014 [Acetobacter malorum DSM 14337]|uniref:HTH cro/C1-type domain-containing protein n=1 Tax=Acetobacter malorum DSM 14337 TaxID=1307910 RepID=A0ABQ0PKT7_9PROT|nr:hypothetical protein AD930_03540 [Acetobacter malorum]GBQ74795.1 hypothetical protein AA14337_0014 [Acetobacter malorum DSM 14337]